MKSISDDDLDKLQKPLSVAYGEREKAEVDELWSVRVMGHVKSLPAYYPRSSFFENLQQLVWRLTPVTVALAMLLSVAIFQLDFTTDYELARIFVEDPLDLSLLGDNAI